MSHPQAELVVVSPFRSRCRQAESIEQVPGSMPHAAMIDNVEIGKHRGMVDLVVGAHQSHNLASQQRPIRLGNSPEVVPVVIARVDPGIPEAQRDEQLLELLAALPGQVTIALIEKAPDLLESAAAVCLYISAETLYDDCFGLCVGEHEIRWVAWRAHIFYAQKIRRSQ